MKITAIYSSGLRAGYQIVCLSIRGDYFMLPSILYIRPFSYCNSKCVMCQCKKDLPGSSRNYNKIKPAFEMFASAGIKEIRITGGEPLLYDGLENIISLFNNNLTHIKIMTNGSLLTMQRIELLLKAGVSEFVISLDGVNPMTHDHLRGIPGLFKTIIKGIKALRNAGEQNTKKILIGITTVISKVNYHSISDFPGLFRELGCDWWAWNPIKDSPSLFLQVEEIMDFYRRAEGVKQELRDCGIKLMVPKGADGSENIYIFGIKDTEIEASTKGQYPANFNCNVVRNVGFVDLEADKLYACPITIHRNSPYSREFKAAADSLETAWSDPVFSEFRNVFAKETHKRCFSCEPALRLLHQDL